MDDETQPPEENGGSVDQVEDTATDTAEAAEEVADADVEVTQEDIQDSNTEDNTPISEEPGEIVETEEDVEEVIEVENTLNVEENAEEALNNEAEVTEDEKNSEDIPSGDTTVTEEIVADNTAMVEAIKDSEENSKIGAMDGVAEEKHSESSSDDDESKETREREEDNRSEKNGDISVEVSPAVDVEDTEENTGVDAEIAEVNEVLITTDDIDAAEEKELSDAESSKSSNSDSSSSSSSGESDDGNDGLTLEMRLEKQKKKKRKKEKRHIKETIQFQDLNVDASGSPIGDLPPPPIVDGVPQYYGYGSIGFTDTSLSPPPPPPTPPPEEQAPIEFTDIAQLSEEDCRTALLQHVSEHCCYGKKPVQNMKITSHTGNTALHLILETFTESRSTKFKRKPYKGESIVGPKNGPPPQPWEIACIPENTFKGDKKKMEIPNTSVVKKCHECHGKGHRKCKGECHGKGMMTCNSCEGSGRSEKTDSEGNTVEDSCFSCAGDGKVRCVTCGGDGKITCNKCEGHKKLRHFVEMKIKFDTHKDEFTKETSDMPDDLVRTVSGDTIFDVVQPMVMPVTTYPVEEINENSAKMVDTHRTKWRQERILMQRHMLRGIPVTEVHYTWDDVNTKYWVYGKERRVYAPDYPHRCCWGCAII